MITSLFISLLLTPLSWLYGAVVSLRGWLYDRGVFSSYRSSLPVISIGNLTAGGNGKTPLCLCVAQELRNRGYAPVILSRGYGGRERGPKRVYHSDTPHTVGDEAIVLFRSAVAPVYVARNRAEGAELIEQDAAGNVIVLDDGFQHRGLKRDIDIVSVYVGSEQAITDFCRGRLLPLGRFREPLATGLRRADIVIATERRVLDAAGSNTAIDARLLALLPDHIKAYRSSLDSDAVRFLSDGSELRPRAVVAVAAIANPDGFFSSLRTLGFHLAETLSFRDHHFFTERELRAIAARHPDVPIVCTVKDGVKLQHMPEDLLQRIACLSVRAKVFPADAFAVQLVRALQVRGQQSRVSNTQG